MMDLWLVVATSFLAGIMDAMVGGGGLITVPALLSTYPSLSPALLLGTNKCSSAFGTLVAATHYAKRVRLEWAWLLPAALVAFAGSWLGAWTLTRVDPQLLRKILPLILLSVLVYTMMHREFGLMQHPVRSLKARLVLAMGIAATIGWYDGFFGPGTGSFFIFLLVRWLGLDFLQASASAKMLNLTTNLAALLLLAATGHVWWQVGLAIAVANVAGNLLGTSLALKHGAVLVRRVFIVMVSLLVLKSGWQAYVP
jgi:uncharacterized membrane protein YfcA